MLIGMEDLSYVLKLVLTTGQLLNIERPVSAIVLARTGSGKSALTSQFWETDGVLYANYITPYMLYKHYGKMLFSNRYHHIIIPDLVTVMAKGREERDPFVAFFNSLIEDGVVRVLTDRMKLTPEHYGIKLSSPVHCGLVTCMSLTDWNRYRSLLPTEGFPSRMLPIAWKYSETTVNEIFEAFGRGEHRKAQKIVPITLAKPGQVEVDRSFEPTLRQWALATRDDTDSEALRRYKQLEGLVMAEALTQKRGNVEACDMRKIEALLDFISYNPKRQV